MRFNRKINTIVFAFEEKELPLCQNKQHETYIDTANRIADKWRCEVFQFTGAAGNMDPAEGPQTYEYAEKCGASLAASLEKVKFVKANNNGVLKLFPTELYNK